MNWSRNFFSLKGLKTAINPFFYFLRILFSQNVALNILYYWYCCFEIQLYWTYFVHRSLRHQHLLLEGHFVSVSTDLMLGNKLSLFVLLWGLCSLTSYSYLTCLITFSIYWEDCVQVDHCSQYQTICFLKNLNHSFQSYSIRNLRRLFLNRFMK